MKCTLNSIIENCLKKTAKVEVIRRYIRMKYRIQIDADAIELRARQMRQMQLA